MKTFRLVSTVFVTLILAACGEDGAPGPPGPRGPQGEPGIPGEIGFVFEYEQLNFTAPDYELILPYYDFEGLDSDVAVVYLLWGVDDIDGEEVEVWRPLPQTVMTESGLLQYNFDFTKYDVRLFLDANFPMDQLTATDTDDWVARVVVIPGEFWEGNARIDLSDYNQVKEMLGLPDLPRHNEVIERREVN